jgi:hypothetical protein
MLLPCGLCVIREFPSVEEVVATLMNIVAIVRPNVDLTFN